MTMETLLNRARGLGHDMKEPRQSDIEPPRGSYSLCRGCGRSAWERPDMQGGHGTAPTHECDG